jgi:predicted secreted hydrolase
MKNKLRVALLPLALLPLLIASIFVVHAQTTENTGYETAQAGYRYQFPRDHFDHPNYQTEWWYYTGNLKSTDGHRFGFELTFFRQGISHDARSDTKSDKKRDTENDAWRIRDLYLAHLAVTDVSGHKFYYDERINRAGPGIAGISQGNGLIWNGNWQAKLSAENHQLRAVNEDMALQLILVSNKPPVIHGHGGISQKAAGIGHASHYISFTRMLTSGSLELNGTTYQVQGTSWMDHEFFTNSMDTNETGWDWLSLQLNDDTELMLYRLRHKNGSVDPYSSGTYVDANGKTIFLSSKNFTMTPSGESWTSGRTRGIYPVHWSVSIPSLDIHLEVATPLTNQELVSVIGPSYWEGVIDITGQRAGRPLQGVGYLEMTGYSATTTPFNPGP